MQHKDQLLLTDVCPHLSETEDEEKVTFSFFSFIITKHLKTRLHAACLLSVMLGIWTNCRSSSQPGVSFCSFEGNSCSIKSFGAQLVGALASRHTRKQDHSRLGGRDYLTSCVDIQACRWRKRGVALAALKNDHNSAASVFCVSGSKENRAEWRYTASMLWAPTHRNLTPSANQSRDMQWLSVPRIKLEHVPQNKSLRVFTSPKTNILEYWDKCWTAPINKWKLWL